MPPAPPVYVQNQAGFSAFRRSPMIETALLPFAQKIQQRAVAISPVVTGRYVSSWYSETGRHDSGLPYARCGNRCPYARYLEYGTHEIHRQRILGRALDAVSAGP